MPHDPALVDEVRGWLSKAGKDLATAQYELQVEPLLRAAAPLTEYAWKFRYPGNPEEPTAEEAETSLATAREVFVAVLKRLPADVDPNVNDVAKLS